jgi:hypothetical protein
VLGGAPRSYSIERIPNGAEAHLVQGLPSASDRRLALGRSLINCEEDRTLRAVLIGKRARSRLSSPTGERRRTANLRLKLAGLGRQ